MRSSCSRERAEGMLDAVAGEIVEDEREQGDERLREQRERRLLLHI